MKCSYLLIVAIACCTLPCHAQQRLQATDTTVVFTVSGLCDQCKHRIEAAAKGKGVSSAGWDIDTRLLTLVYTPSQITLEKIRGRILAAGHDLETQKAKDRVYNDLPSCCHYREPQLATGMHIIKGIVIEEDKKGGFAPLAGASVIWLGTDIGTLTDSTGTFTLGYDEKPGRLVVSYSGYKPDTLAITGAYALRIMLAADRQLNAVVVSSKQPSTFLSSLSPVRTQIMTDRELFKAACCNLSESFETNPSVDVSYNDAVTGSKQIQLLGLSGNYTQLTVENLPGPRGIATPLGLNSIAGTWVESIQLTKGIGSVANGYESIAGQINVELRKPETSDQLYANAYINDFGKTDLNLQLAGKFGRNWSGGLLLHDDFLANKRLDVNQDGFRDLPTGHQLNLIDRWKFDNGKGILAQFGVKVLNDRRIGGQVDYNPSADKLTTNHYGLGINTDRYEAFAKIGYVFPEKRYKSIGLQLSAIDHKQDSYFGLTTYNAGQKNFYGNLIYQSIINSTIHKFRGGISFLYDQYSERFRSTGYKRKEIVPGAFFEYTYTPSGKFSAVAGIRIDHHNLFGVFFTPRLNIRYEPINGTTFRVSAGRGQRTANIFAENMSVFVSDRQVEVLGATAGKAYGLDPEVAWNKGISLDQKLRLFKNDALFSIDFFRNDFTNQVVVDLENARSVKFYNLQGRSYSNSLQAELNVEPLKKFDLRLAYRYFDVKTTYGGRLQERPLVAASRAFISADYTVNGWKFDYTFNYNGRKRIPNTSANPAQYQLPGSSPAYFLMNAQISKTVGRRRPMDLYIGAENIGNYYQKNPVLAAAQPFSPYFDASLVWGPVTGRMFYAGWRWRLK